MLELEGERRVNLASDVRNNQGNFSPTRMSKVTLRMPTQNRSVLSVRTGKAFF
jgi:hypothetical protein